MQITPEEFQVFRTLIHELCGLHILEDKTYLILQRLEGLVRESGCASFSEFHAKAQQPDAESLHERIIVAMTTNETSFFRDGAPFNAFKAALLPRLGARVRQARAEAEQDGQNPAGSPPWRVRIWCAGASTGQEPYSLAMLVHDYASANKYLGVRSEDFHILATDISSDVLDVARKGAFNDVEIARGLPDSLRDKFFRKTDGRRPWVLDKGVRDLVEFRRTNLVQGSGLFCGFDVIFCRNVLIYFDDATKRTIIESFRRRLNPGGYLILGSAENLYELSTGFEGEYVEGATLYRKKDAINEQKETNTN